MSKKDASPTDKDIFKEIESMTDEPDAPPVVTSGALEDRLSITRRAISRRLNSLVEDRPDKLKRAKISNTNVYWKPEDEPTEIIPEEDEDLLMEYIENQEGISRRDVIDEVIDRGLDQVSRTEEIRTKWENREVSWWGTTSDADKNKRSLRIRRSRFHIPLRTSPRNHRGSLVLVRYQSDRDLGCSRSLHRRGRHSHDGC